MRISKHSNCQRMKKALALLLVAAISLSFGSLYSVAAIGPEINFLGSMRFHTQENGDLINGSAIPDTTAALDAAPGMTDFSRPDVVDWAHITGITNAASPVITANVKKDVTGTRISFSAVRGTTGGNASAGMQGPFNKLANIRYNDGVTNNGNGTDIDITGDTKTNRDRRSNTSYVARGNSTVTVTAPSKNGVERTLEIVVGNYSSDITVTAVMGAASIPVPPYNAGGANYWSGKLLFTYTGDANQDPLVVTFKNVRSDGGDSGGWVDIRLAGACIREADPDTGTAKNLILTGAPNGTMNAAYWYDRDYAKTGFEPGELVEISAGASPQGKQFIGWVVKDGTVTLEESSSPVTTFVMPDEDVEIEAIWEDYQESTDNSIVSVAGSSAITWGGGDGTDAAKRMTASINVPPNQSSFQMSAVTVHEKAQLAFYADEAFTTPQAMPISLTANVPHTVFIKVTSENGTPAFYEVTLHCLVMAVTYGDAGRSYGVIAAPAQGGASKDRTAILGMYETEWNDIAWRGDVVSKQLLLATDATAIDDIRVEPSDLTSGTNTISSANIKTSKLLSVKAATNRAGGTVPGANIQETVPDIISPSSRIVGALAANSVQPIWISLSIPQNTAPGIYTGTITVTAEQLPAPVAFAVSIEVLNLVQPEGDQTEFYLDLWQYPYAAARYYDVEPWSTEHWAYLKEQYTILRDAGQRTITTTITHNPWGQAPTGQNQQTYDEYPGMVEWTQVSGTGQDIQFAFDYTVFDNWVQFCLDLGINKQIDCYSMLPWGNRFQYYNASGVLTTVSNMTSAHAYYVPYWSQFLDSFIDHLYEKGWLDLAYIAFDERSIADMTAVVDLIKSKRAPDNSQLKITAALNYGQINNALFDRIENVSLSISEVDNDFYAFVEKRRNLGMNSTLYTCVGKYPNNFTRSQPAESAWVIFYSQKYNANGFLRWAYDAWTKNPLETTDHWYWESGDCFQIYPAAAGQTVPQGTPSFELMMQGIRDAEKANTLKRVYPEAASEINDLFDSITKPVQNTHYIRLIGGGSGWEGTAEGHTKVVTDVKMIRDGLAAISKRYLASNTPVITSVEVTTPTIVETLAANLRVNAAGENLEGQTLTAYLSVDGVIDESTAADITSGTCLMKITAAPAAGTNCQVVVKADGTGAQRSFAMTVTAYKPEDLWSPILGADDDGFLTVRFSEDIAPGSKGYGAKVGQTAYACEPIGARLLRINVAADSVASDVAVSGVKYPILFPSYSFTFTLTR